MKVRGPFFSFLAALSFLMISMNPGCGRKDTPDTSAEEHEAAERLSEIEATVAAIEKLQRERFFWIRFLDALRGSKPKSVWFTEIHPFTTKDGRSRILLRGYLKPANEPSNPTIDARTPSAAVAQLVCLLESEVEYLRNVVHTEPMMPVFIGDEHEAFVAFWLVADLTQPDDAPMESSSSETLGKRINALIEQFQDPQLPKRCRDDIATDPIEWGPGPGEKQCAICNWIVPDSVAWCPRCSPRHPHQDEKDDLATD